MKKVWVDIIDSLAERPSQRKELAHCRFKTTLMSLSGLDPFNEYEFMTNSIGAAVDSGTVIFYASAEIHPKTVIGNTILAYRSSIP
jgi:hypothetical protein